MSEERKPGGKTHELNTWPTYFDAVKAGHKPWEVRRNDRFFQKGDIVILRRLAKDATSAGYCSTHDPMTFKIGCILQGGQFGIEPGYCVFTLVAEEAEKDG